MFNNITCPSHDRSHEATRDQHAQNATPLILLVMCLHSGRKQCARAGMFVDVTLDTQTEKRGTFGVNFVLLSDKMFLYCEKLLSTSHGVIGQNFRQAISAGLSLTSGSDVVGPSKMSAILAITSHPGFHCNTLLNLSTMAVQLSQKPDSGFLLFPALSSQLSQEANPSPLKLGGLPLLVLNMTFIRPPTNCQCNVGSHRDSPTHIHKQACKSRGINS
uniref:Uncharacterized protein n=1 Tax=Timema douglasi TaxID=61478 RepID=A0A7R8VTD1_TIMDO|nr:unnamed protein product [Timema douglasi]